MKNKLMIIAYNDNGECYVQNYCDGEITINNEGKYIQTHDGLILGAEPKHTDITMKKLHKHNLTLSELDDVIGYLKNLRSQEFL